jgi:photosystem I P700 chlorophyll a apoprotein A2
MLIWLLILQHHTHHKYIAGFIYYVWCFCSRCYFFIRDYDPEQNKGNVLARILDHKAIISHLSWVSLFLGFHTLGLYVHIMT